MEIFVAVVRHESFSGAARALGLTASAVSKQVRNLEQDLKAKLLNRTTRRVALTEEGAILYERGVRALADIREAAERIDELKSSPRGPLRLSAPMSFGIGYLAQPIAAFAALYPDVTLDVRFDDRVVDIVEEGFDLAVRIAAPEDSTMIARRLAPCPFKVCASPAYLAARGEPLAPGDLSSRNVLAYTRNRGAHEWRYRDAAGRDGAVALSSTFRCDTAEMMVEAARQDLGIIICPAFFVADDLREGRLRSVLDAWRTWPERGVYAMFPPGRHMSTRLRLLVEHLAGWCAKNLPS